MDRGPNDQPTEAKGGRIVLFAEADPFLTKIFQPRRWFLPYCLSDKLNLLVAYFTRFFIAQLSCVSYVGVNVAQL